MRFGGDQQQGDPLGDRRLHHHHDARCDPLADRRQRARETYWDNRQYAETAALDEAIETATRVNITEDVIAAAVEVGDLAQGTKNAWRTLAAAFRAAGFEVEE